MEQITQMTAQEQRLLDKIRVVRESKSVEEIIRRINSYAENFGISKLKHRIKQEDSALRKFRQKEYTDADQMGDICGVMLITDDADQLYTVCEFIKECFADTEIKIADYIQNPKVGYRSLHMNYTMRDIPDMEGFNLPLEIQLKTRSMLIAQDTVHDSVYKNDRLSKTIRNELSKIIFPMIEKMCEIDRLRAIGENDEANRLYLEVHDLIKENAAMFRDHYPIDRVFKEYGKTVFKHKNESYIEKEAFLYGYTPQAKEKRRTQFEDTIDAVFDYFKEEGFTVQGKDHIKYAVEKMKALDYETFSALLLQIHHAIIIEDPEQDTEIETASLDDFEKMDEMVPAEMRNKVLQKVKALQKAREIGGKLIGN